MFKMPEYIVYSLAEIVYYESFRLVRLLHIKQPKFYVFLLIEKYIFLTFDLKKNIFVFYLKKLLTLLCLNYYNFLTCLIFFFFILCLYFFLNVGKIKSMRHVCLYTTVNQFYPRQRHTHTTLCTTLYSALSLSLCPILYPASMSLSPESVS